MPPSLHILGAPSSAGAYAPGQERAPAAFRRFGLIPQLEAAGLAVRDLGDIAEFRWRLDARHPRSMNVEAARAAALAVAERTRSSLRDGARVLVLGGDCTVELGTVAAATADGRRVGLIYFDLDADLNTPDTTTDGALDWMGVAHLLGLPGADPRLVALASENGRLAPEQVLLFSVGRASAPERERIATLQIAEIPLEEVGREPESAAQRAVEWGRRFDRLLVHLDVDVLDYASFPIAENTRRGVGLDLPTLHRALATLLRAANFAALTVTEVNPDHAPDEKTTFEQLIAVLASALSGDGRSR